METTFGTVTTRRVIYYRSKGWFAGGSREDIPLQHVTSVRLDTARSVIVGLLLALFGLALLKGEGAGGNIMGFFIGVFGFLLIWGSPVVVVNTAGRDLNEAKGFPWQASEANAFVEALRQELFRKS